MSETVNNGGIHNFKVEPIERGRAKVYIDGKPIRCRGYSLEHFVDCVPSVQLEMCVSPQIDENVRIEVANKKEIAELMDKNEFEQFCEIWKRVHDESHNRKISMANEKNGI